MPLTSKKEQALSHLKKDKVLKEAISHSGPVKIKRDLDLYRALLRAIVGQQLSVKAAQTIWQRFVTLFESENPAAHLLLQVSDEKLRSVGLSFQKAGYLKNIALFSIEKSLDYKQLKKLSDEELIDYLVQIKGVGRWTVEMILMFNLNRQDIFPIDDLGIQNGMKKLYLFDAPDKKTLYKKMTAIAEHWRPYRTLACMYIWRFKDAKPL